MFIVKHCHFNICYSKKIINVRTYPDLLFSLLQVKYRKVFRSFARGPNWGAHSTPQPPAVVNSVRSLRELRSYCSLCSLWKFAICYFVFAGPCAADQNPW